MFYGFKLLAWFIVPATFAVAIYMCLSCVYNLLEPYCDAKIWPLLHRGKRDGSAKSDHSKSKNNMVNVNGINANAGWTTDGSPNAMPVGDDGRV
ncbi:unnamed protein product [Orchesella dallaii]|uniref:Uncharacterized protein n=1 Tax=Orchesella dallaii TaxID=48710 RepID=A0ABP1RY82_9HEXA